MIALAVVFAVGAVLLLSAVLLHYASAGHRYKTRRRMETAANICALYGLGALAVAVFLILPIAAGV